MPHLQVSIGPLAMVAHKRRPAGLLSFLCLQLFTDVIQFIFHNIHKTLKNLKQRALQLLVQ